MVTQILQALISLCVVVVIGGIALARVDGGSSADAAGNGSESGGGAPGFAATTRPANDSTKRAPVLPESGRVLPQSESDRATPNHYITPSLAVLEQLPEAKYDAVIAALLPAVHSTPLSTMFEADDTTIAGWPVNAVTIHSLSSDAALYAVRGGEPVARFAAHNFLGDNSVVVAITVIDDWALVLTPARQSLPSATSGAAPAQTMAWIRSSFLRDSRPSTHHVVISLSAQTLTVRATDSSAHSMAGHTVPDQIFPAGIGADDTPTPRAVTGYLQARYRDAAQNQADHAVQLTSLHSAAADEPYGGSVGGLIGIHYEKQATGAVSHGCIRLSAEALAAVDGLPLGTPVTIVE